MLLHARQHCYQLSDYCTYDTLLLHGCAGGPMVTQLYGLALLARGGAVLLAPCLMSKVYAKEIPE